jgi:hypothetical protein
MVEINIDRSEFARSNSYDEYECFHISDFEAGDAIRVKTGDYSFVRAVVTGVSYSKNLIFFKTRDSQKNQTSIDSIVSLEYPTKDWLA